MGETVQKKARRGKENSFENGKKIAVLRPDWEKKEKKSAARESSQRARREER